MVPVVPAGVQLVFCFWANEQTEQCVEEYIMDQSYTFHGGVLTGWNGGGREVRRDRERNQFQYSF